MSKDKGNVLFAALEKVDAQQDNSGLESAAGSTTPQKSRVKKPAAKKPQARKPSREGTVMIGGHFPPSVKQQLRMIAAEEDTTTQALLQEALNLLFVKKGRGKIK